MASHSSGDEGRCKYIFQMTLYIASHFDTVDFPIPYENDKGSCDSSIARNRRVIESLSILVLTVLGFREFISCLEINDSINLTKWSKPSEAFVCTLKINSALYFTHYGWLYGRMHSEMFLRMKKNIEKYLWRSYCFRKTQAVLNQL